MTIDRAVFAIAGLMIIASVVLAVLHTGYWLILTAFLGLNLFQAAFTGFCPVATMLRRLGFKPGNVFP
jgi:hypothetical protein